MQSDARLVEDVCHPDQARTDLRRKTDPLCLSSRKRSRCPRKGQIIESHIRVSDNTAAGKNPELTLVANGSDVLLEHQAAELLRAEGKAVRVVSMISPALFLKQEKAYRDQVLVPWTPVFALSSGLPVLFDRVVGGFGKACGLERFGASAPAGVLEKEFGYVPEAVAAKAKEYLAEFAQNVEAFKKVNG